MDLTAVSIIGMTLFLAISMSWHWSFQRQTKHIARNLECVENICAHHK